MLSVLFAESADNFSRLLEFYAPAATRVLDVTFGGGTLTKRARVRVYGIDKDPETTPAVRADARSLPFLSGSFPVAVYDPPYLYGSVATGCRRDWEEDVEQRPFHLEVPARSRADE